MPIYEFHCADCGHRFDRLQKLSDPDPTECPACAARAVRRALTAPQFRLAGGGWYETDFKKDGETKRNLVEGGGASGGAEAKPESKPAEAKPSEAKAAPKADPKPAAG